MFSNQTSGPVPNKDVPILHYCSTALTTSTVQISPVFGQGIYSSTLPESLLEFQVPMQSMGDGEERKRCRWAGEDSWLHREIISMQLNMHLTTSWPLYSEILIPLEWLEYLMNIYDFLTWIWGHEIFTFSQNFVEVLLKSCAAMSKFVSYSFMTEWFQSLFESSDSWMTVFSIHFKYETGYKSMVWVHCKASMERSIFSPHHGHQVVWVSRKLSREN